MNHFQLKQIRIPYIIINYNNEKKKYLDNIN